MDPIKQIAAVVIRKDGTVPFDEHVPDHVREHMIRHLAQMGHTIQDVAGSRNVMLAGFNPEAHKHMEAAYFAKHAKK